jgi:(p)ppGpp synthase/HD superfamily hydrolase
VTKIFESELVLAALKFAEKAHEGQVRKYTGLPYIVHPIEVASIVATVPHTQEQLAAALLHDVVEDTAVTLEEVGQLFGEKVATLVDELTDFSKKNEVVGNRAYRKGLDRDYLGTISAEAQTVKYADLISNGVDIVSHDKHFAKVYLREKDAILEVMNKGDATLFAIAQKIVGKELE